MELGPYAYRIVKAKHRVVFSPDHAAVSYAEAVTLRYEPSRSGQGLTESDSLLTLNVAMCAANELMWVRGGGGGVVLC